MQLSSQAIPPAAPVEVKETGEAFPVTLNWTKGFQFVGRDDRNHVLVLDANIEAGGDQSGPTPGRLFLAAIAGCTAMDVIDILQKSRQKVSGFSVQVRSIQNEDYPKYHKEIYLRYILTGTDLDKSRVERAIRLSQEKYCPVGATVRGKAKIFTEYAIVQDSGSGKL